MIIELSIENFLSIKEKVTIHLDSGQSKKLPRNLIILPDNTKLLKSVAIYGANASGKSNLFKSIFFILNMVKTSHKFNVNDKIPRVPFKLDKGCLNKPSKFEILFIYKNIKYKYGFSCDNDKVVDEYLFYWPRGRESQIFNRIETKKFEFKADKKQQELIKSQMNDNVLYLSRATQLGYEKTKDAYEFIVNNIVINYHPSSWTDFTIRQIHEMPKLKEWIIHILQKADFGGITDIKVSKEKRKVNGFEFKIDKDVPSFNPIKQKEEDFFDIKFLHKDEKGNQVELSFEEESGGTQKTLAMLGPLFDILENGKVAFIDELELNLHPIITRFIVRLFNSENNKDAQLIFTTHDTTLLDNELIRRDQVYLCSKEPNKYTVLSSLLDFDLRETSDFERAYLTGRVGGLPFIDETFFNEKW